MRALMIDDANRAEVERVRQWAERPENYYKPFAGNDAAVSVSGDDKRFTCHLNDYRCVYTITEGDCLYRQLSISVPSADYAHPAAAFTIAEMFGFTGWDGKTISRIPHGWLFNVNIREHCVTLVQKYVREEYAAAV